MQTVIRPDVSVSRKRFVLSGMAKSPPLVPCRVHFNACVPPRFGATVSVEFVGAGAPPHSVIRSAVAAPPALP